jgi:hypothetical protein
MANLRVQRGYWRGRPGSNRRRPAWENVFQLIIKNLGFAQKINLHSGASAGWADARRRDAGDVVHLRVATTQQMPARRRAPEGGQLSELQYSKYVSHMIIKPESRQQNVKLFLREP